MRYVHVIVAKIGVALMVVLPVFVSSGCGHSHLSSRKMVAVLTDLHRMDGMLQVTTLNRGHEVEEQAYYDAVLDKHGVTRAVFDSSLVWYTHHPQRFNKLYPRVLKNLEGEHRLFVGEAEQLKLLREARETHFAWFTYERVMSTYKNTDLLEAYRLPPPDTVSVAVPLRDKKRKK